MAKRLTKREKQQINRTVKKHWQVILVIVLLIAILFAVAYYMGWLDKFLKIIDMLKYRNWNHINAQLIISSFSEVKG